MKSGIIDRFMSSSHDSNICSSASQNTSDIFEACFRNRISRSIHLAGGTRRRSMTQVARRGVTLNLFGVVVLLYGDQATASIILMIFCFRNQNCSNASPSVRPLKLKVNLLEVTHVSLESKSSTSFFSFNTLYATRITDLVDVKADLSCIIRRLQVARNTAFYCNTRRSVGTTV